MSIRNARRYVSIIMALAAAAVLCGFPPAQAARSSYFDMSEKESTNIKPFPKWTSMVSRFESQEEVSDDSCGKVRFHPCSILQWHRMLDGLKNKPLHQQLDQVNNWSNEHPYIEDQVNWGLEDYWGTPYEFMEISGDCEDYAISKYYSLKELGVPIAKMRIIILQDLNLGGIIHAVLGVYDGKELFILDNQSQHVTPAMRIYHYRPIFGINEDAWWAYYPKN